VSDTNLPSTSLFGDYNAEDDFKDMRAQDKVLPRLRLAQHTSNQVKEGLVKPGAWFNSATVGTVIPHDKMGVIIPIMFWLEWMEWNPNKDAPKGIGPGKAILARDTDPNGELAKSAARFEKIMTKRGEKMRVTEYYSFLVLAPEATGNYTDMMMLNFSKTAHKVGKMWLNRMRSFMVKGPTGMPERCPMAAVAWDLGREEAVKDGDKYFVPKIGEGKLLPLDVISTTIGVAREAALRRNDVVRANVAEDEKEATVEAVRDDSEL
jgi:hypothetical protein